MDFIAFFAPLWPVSAGRERVTMGATPTPPSLSPSHRMFFLSSAVVRGVITCRRDMLRFERVW